MLTPDEVLKGAAESLSPEESARRERQRVSTSGFADFQIADDSNHILVTLSGKLYVLTRSTGRVAELDTGKNPIIDPKFSADSKFVSYVSNNDLYVLDLAYGKATQVTHGGNEKISHGVAEFVAQEEMDRSTGYWWSPDGKSIAYENADATKVEVWNLADPEHPDQKPISWLYPRPGKNNVKVGLGIISRAGGNTVWVKWDTQKYPYLASVAWAKHGPLTLIVETRDQKDLMLLAADPASGKTTRLLTEHDNDWINLYIYKDLPDWLADGSGFVWATERDGGPALELRDRDGKFVRTLVKPDEGFVSKVDLDSKIGTVTFLASSDPTQIQVFRAPLKGGEAKKLSQSEGVHYATFAKDHLVYADEATAIDKMPITTIHGADGKLLGVLPSEAEDPPIAPRAQIVHVAGSSSVDEHRDFYACVVRPENFDSKRKYPVITDVYGGPGVNKVTASMRLWIIDQWLADQGFIIVAIDGRGTPRRGRDWERALSCHFGSVPLADQVAGLEALARQFPEIDAKCAGIMGWSFGGYMSALAVLQHPDVFKAAVAGAPVVDWLDYDTHYTERYLGLPESNAQAYREGSLLTYAQGLTRPLLLVHGTTDDNVFFRHSLKLSDALFRAGADFEFLPLSGFTHMVRDPVVTQNLWSRIAVFFRAHL
jgi:dipeptidyl-peptidase-4